MDDLQAILSNLVRVMVDPQTAAVALAVIGLNIHFGYTGLLNIGQAGFMLLGAYGFAITIKEGHSTFLGVVVGLAVAMLFALVLGVPTLTLRGDYLAIVTISAAEIIRYLGRSVAYPKLFHLTGGAQGIGGKYYKNGFTSLSPWGDDYHQVLKFNYADVSTNTVFRLFCWLVVAAIFVALVQVLRGKTGLEGTSRTVAGWVLGVVGMLGLFFIAPVTQQGTGANGWWFSIVTWALVIICSLIVLGLTKSPWGRLLRGVREDEDAMRSLGKNVFAVKMQALVIGGLFGAIGGIMYVLPATVQPDSLGRSMTFNCYTALFLGGAATIWGPALGSLIFFVGRILIKTVSATYLTSDHLPIHLNGQRTDQFAYIVVGVGLMLLVIFRPQGILGDKRELRFNV